ncbi:hypothetical protein ACHAPQ_003764 [Fusarium lateritium]
MKTKPTYKKSPSDSDSPYFADTYKSVRKTQRNKAKRESRQDRRRREIKREWDHKATFACMTRRVAHWMERALKAENELKEREIAEKELAENEPAEELHRALCDNSQRPSPNPRSSVTNGRPFQTMFMRNSSVSLIPSTSITRASASAEVPGCDFTAVPFDEFLSELESSRKRAAARRGVANEEFWKNLENPAGKTAVQNHRYERRDYPGLFHFWKQVT